MSSISARFRQARRHAGLLAGLAFAMMISASGVAAQDSASKAPRPRPIWLTNFGIYAVNYGTSTVTAYDGSGFPLARASGRATDPRVLADWGVIIPTGAKSGFGASLMISVDEDWSFAAIFGRYRHVIDSSRSIDLALGVPLSNDNQHRVAPLGLIKYNATRKLGIAVRPELDRVLDYTYYPAPPRYRNNFRISAGAELGGLPGAITSVTAGVAFLAAFIAFIASGGFE